MVDWRSVPLPGEEPFGTPTDEDRAAVSKGGPRRTYHHLGAQWDPDRGPKWDHNATPEENAAAQQQGALGDWRHEQRQKAKEMADAYNNASPEEQQKMGGGEPAGGDPRLEYERKAAFAFGLNQIAGQLHSISEHQGDLFTASQRFYPGTSVGGRPSRERSIH